jgi:capsular polysaccharide transport system permease protein
MTKTTSWIIQKRVIHALLIRELITRYGRHNVGVLWLFLEPMLFTLGVTAIWTLMRSVHGSSIPITAFAVTGYSTLLLWRNCTNRAVKAIEVNLSLLYHRNVKVMDVLVARILIEVIGATISAIVLTLIFSFLGLMKLPVDVLLALSGWFLLIWFSVALAFVVGAFSEKTEILERVWHIITYLFFPLSGAGFMVDWLPIATHKYILLVPMVHATEMIRHGYLGSTVRTYEDPVYLIVVTIFLTLLGQILLADTAKNVQPE